MGWTIGIPSLKLSSTNNKSKHCGNFYRVAAEALQERLGRDQDINHELSHLNIYYGYPTAEALVNYSNEHCSTLTDAKGRKIRSDSVRMCVTILKPPAAYMASLTYDEQCKLLDDGINKIKELVREENVKSIAIHFDEQGPHAHVFWEPITEDGRLCAKELHGLKFFSRLNNELPRHLRSCGWNIDDCNAYDQAQANLMSEQEKAEQRRKNGRSSSVFKAEIEIKRNRIEAQIESDLDNLEKQVESRVENSLEEVFDAQDDVYNDALFLITNCDDALFKELSEEGRWLKKLLLYKEMHKINYIEGFRPLVEQICDAEHREVSWEARTQMWNVYRQVSDEFWQMRKHLDCILSDEYHRVCDERYATRQSYYDAVGFLRESRNIFTMLIATVWALHEVFREDQLMDELSALKHERKQLYANTRSFKYYCSVYRCDLKAGVCPIEKYMKSMQIIVERLDNEHRRFKDLQQIERPIVPEEIDKTVEITPD